MRRKRERRLTNARAIRAYALDYAQKHRRGHRWTRVSKVRLAEIERTVRVSVEKWVESAPSLGKTL
jgi:hypothetical protein